MKKIIFFLSLLGVFFTANADNHTPAVPSAMPNTNDEANTRFVKKDYVFSDLSAECIFEKLRDGNNQLTGEHMLISCASQKVYREDNNTVPLVAGFSYEVNQGQVAPFPSFYMVTPLGVYLAPIGINVDDKGGFQVPYRQCTRQGCNAAFMFDQKVFDIFKQGVNVGIQLFLDPTQEPKKFTYSLKGFTSTSDFLQKVAGYLGKKATFEEIENLTK